MTLFDLPEPEPTLRVGLKSLAGRHDCTTSGIAERCHGGCCRNPTYWPVRIDPSPNGCAALGPDGCRLGDGRPVTCHLYPLHGDTTLTLHFRTRLKTSCCAGNAGEGPPLHEALRTSLEALLEDGEYQRIADACASGTEGAMDVRARPGVAERLAEDHAAEAEGRWPSYVDTSAIYERTVDLTLRDPKGPEVSG
jgi:hypothetical protein